MTTTTPPRGPEEHKAAARQLGLRGAQDLYVLAADNDPFAKGRPSHWRDAEWFAGLWDEFGYSTDVHLRRVHYRMVTDPHPERFTLPTGEPYLNTDACWGRLCLAGTAARILGLIDVEAVADRRNPDPVLHRMARQVPPDVPGVGFDAPRWSLPDLDVVVEYLTDVRLELPTPHARGYDYDPDDQPVLLELWIEKSTMADVLIPVCRRAGANYVEGLGFESITQVVRLLRRAERHGKPAHIVYVSDFDPAGATMPTAVARQLQYWRESLEITVDISVDHVALTHDQCVEYELPRSPIKEKDKRAGRFEARYGEGATELDALEAIHPGDLAEITRHAMAPHLDPTLRRRLAAASVEAAGTIALAWRQASAPLAAEAERLAAEARGLMAGQAEQLAELFNSRLGELEPLQERAARLVAEAERLADELDIDLPDRPEPVTDGGNGRPLLFDSRRDWLEQLKVFKARQGKEA
jgi:hypothetical protein